MNSSCLNASCLYNLKIKILRENSMARRITSAISSSITIVFVMATDPVINIGVNIITDDRTK
jgi:hypothetical protein